MMLAIGIIIYFAVFTATAFISEKYTPVVGVGGLLVLLAALKWVA